MKKKRFLAWLTAASICLSAFVTPYVTMTANAMTTLETDVTIASEECTILGVYGSYYSQPQAALDRINEIRKEACEAGNVPDPRQPSRTLTPADYVPLKWSTDLESIARLRAAEGGLAFNFLSSGHDRLNGKGTFSISSNGISSSAENLAYNGGTSMVYGIDQWYGEKADWVGQVAGKVTGHYTSMINPNYTYVGLGDFYTEEASYPNTLAGEFCSSSQELNQTMQDELNDVMQKIEVKNSYMTDYILDGMTTIYTDKTTTLTPKINLVNGSKRHKLWVITPIIYTSSNDSIATVTTDGIVTGHRNGEAVITAQSNGSVLASVTITVKCDHTKELLASTLPTCTTEGSKIYHCEICGESIEQKIPKTAHNYVYGDADSEGYRTGICSVCQDTLKIIPPTTYKLWWRSSTSDSQSYSSLFPGSNPVGSTIYCWINEVDGDENYRDMVIESSDESVVSVPETVTPNSHNNQLHVLAPGITILTIYPTYNPALKKTLTVRIGDSNSVDITTADTVLSQSSYPYTGKACTPDVSVSYHDVPLKVGTDYAVTYENNMEIGTATVIITGKGIFSGTIRKNFTITGSSTQEPEVPEIKELSNCTIMLSPASYVYDGTAKMPVVTVKDGEKVLTKDTDYTVSYKDNINIGTAKVVVTGKGNYKGKVTKGFTIKVKKGISYKVGSYQYKVTGTSTVSMTAVNGNKVKKVKVPKTVKIGGKTFKVTAIANNAFKNNKKITSVEIGDNVKTIGTSAFAGCTKITKATLGKGVMEIGSSAFKGCKKLGTITVKSTKLKKVGKNALKGIKATAKVKVSAKKLSAYKKLFKNKGQGKKVKIVK